MIKILLFLTGYMILCSCLESTETKLKIFIPSTYKNGICIIGFTGEVASNNNIEIKLNTNGVGIVNGMFKDFQKSKTMEFYMNDDNGNAKKLPNFLDRKRNINPRKVYFQHGLTINMNGKTFLLFRVGNKSFLKSEFKIEDPEIDEKINSIIF